MKKIVILLFGILANVNICFAQEIGKIYGIVKDSITNTPIEFANIVLMTEDSTFLAGAVTDSLGVYELNSKNINESNNYIIQATHIGHEKKMIKAHISGTESIIDIQLTSNNISLPDITITGIRTKVKNRINFNYTFTDQMRDKARLTSKLLENIPTVFVDCNSTIHIKGSSNILILKNGIELTDNSLVDQIRPESVRNVEIMYNIPSKYANRNYTAIMNIITKKDQGYNLMLDNKTAVDGSMNDTKINVGFETEKSSIYLFYKQHYRRLLQNTESKMFDNSETLLVDDNYIISPHKECDNEFFYGYSFQPHKKFQVGFDGYLSLYREKLSEKYNHTTQDMYALKDEKISTQNYKVYTDYKDDNNHLITEISFNKKDIKDNDTYFSNDNKVKQNEDQELYGIKIDYNRNFDETAVLYNGIKFYHQKNNGLFNNRYSDQIEKYNCNNIFAYSEFMKSFGEHWIVDVGLSFQRYQRSFVNGIKIKDTDIFPKFKTSFSWKDNNLALGYSSSLKDPSIWQMLSFIKKESSNIYTKGNPYIRPEKRGTLSLEYSYSKGDLYLGTSAYFKKTSNPIVNKLSTEGDNAILEFTNINNSNNYGIDVTLSCPLTKWWNINFYGDLYNRNISSNCYYKKNDFSYMAQIQSVWSIYSKITAILQYSYNSKELIYNGYNKPYNSSIGMINYSVNDYLDLYMVLIQPFENLKGETKVYNQAGSIKMKDTVHSQKIMLCLTFTFNKGKKIKKKELYQDESKKLF